MSRRPQVGDRVTVQGTVTRVLEVEPGVTAVFVVFGEHHPRHAIGFEVEDVTVIDQPVVVADSDGRRWEVPRG